MDYVNNFDGVSITKSMAYSIITNYVGEFAIDTASKVGAKKAVVSIVGLLATAGIMSMDDAIIIDVTNQVLSRVGALRAALDAANGKSLYLNQPMFWTSIITNYLADIVAERLGGMGTVQGAAAHYMIRELQVAVAYKQAGIGGAILSQAMLAGEDLVDAARLTVEFVNAKRDESFSQKQSVAMEKIAQLRSDYKKATSEYDEAKVWNEINTTLVDLYADGDTGIVPDVEKAFIRAYLGEMDAAKESRDSTVNEIIQSGISSGGKNRLQMENFLKLNYNEAQAAYWLRVYDNKTNNS